jgi:hypothetical protein
MEARGVTNNNNAKAKAAANKELNNKRIFGKSAYKVLWENILPLPPPPPPKPAPAPVPPKPAPPPKPAAAGKPVVNVRGRMNAAIQNRRRIYDMLSVLKSPQNNAAIQDLTRQLDTANNKMRTTKALFNKLGGSTNITLEELNSIFAHLQPGTSVNNRVKAWRDVRGPSLTANLQSAMSLANSQLNKKRGAFRGAKYTNVWAELLKPPAPVPAPPQLPPKQNRKVNVTGAPSGTQVNITRQLNASGQKYNAWNFAGQSNAAKYNINNRNTNNPIVKLKKSQVNQNFNRVYTLYNNNNKVRTIVSVANTNRALKNLTAAAQKAGKAQNQTVLNAMSRLRKHRKALAVTEQAIRNVKTNTNMMKKIKINGTPYIVQVSRKKSWGGQIQPWRITSANALQIFTINKANTNSPEVKFK